MKQRNSTFMCFHKAKKPSTKKVCISIQFQSNPHSSGIGLKEVIRIACMIALVVGSELHETTVVPRDSPIIESMATSAVSLYGIIPQKINKEHFLCNCSFFALHEWKTTCDKYLS